MLNRESVGLISYFLRRYPRRSALIVVLLILSGFAEGFGIASLLPVVELAVAEPGASESEIMRVTRDIFALVGVTPTLEMLLLLVFVGMTAKAAFLWLAMKQVGFTVARVGTDLRLSLIRALLRARWGYYVSQPTGVFSNAIGSEAHRASGSYREACNVLAGLIQVLVYIGIAFLISWQVAALALVGGTVLGMLLGSLVRSARLAGKQQTKLMKSLIARLTDALQGIKPVKAMARERHLRPLLEGETRELNAAQERQVLASETLKLFQEPLLVLLLAAGLYGMIAFGNQPFATVLVTAFLFYRLVGRVQAVQRHYQQMAVGESAFWSLHESVAAAEAHSEPSRRGGKQPTLEQGIRLHEVEFGYGEKQVLKGVSLSVPAGQFVSIIGPSGAGKTTIADLIIGLYRPDSGAVLVDGVPLDALSMGAWRASIGYVPQEMFLFHDTILRNVTLGDESIPREAVEQALRTAGAWEFVASLRDGLDTVAGERGTKLSGGQRQRIAIARALVHNPKLLVLDEVTTALDPKTEAAICATLRALRGAVTIISISHQPAMREAADIVYRLDLGRITETAKAPVDAAVVA